MSVVAQEAHGAGGDRTGSASLSIRSVDLVYETTRGNIQALKGLDFDVEAGSFVSVVGMSGCGKSSLLKLVSGLLETSAGRIELDGKQISGPRRDVGMVFQQPTLLPWKSVLENVLVPIRAMGQDVSKKRDRAMELLEMLKMDGFAKHYPFELSGGMQQRVGVARGLIHDPILLLMDEPFAALDALTRETTMRELQQIWLKTGKTVLFITHSIPEAVFLSDRIVVMSPRPGRVHKIIDVDLPRPRSMDDMAEPAFVEISNELRQIFRSMERDVAR